MSSPSRTLDRPRCIAASMCRCDSLCAFREATGLQSQGSGIVTQYALAAICECVPVGFVLHGVTFCQAIAVLFVLCL